MAQYVEHSDTPYKDEVIDIIRNSPEQTWGRNAPTDRWLTLIDSRNKRLMELRGGTPYRYMQQEIFPKMRTALVVTVSSELTPQKTSVIINQAEQVYIEGLIDSDDNTITSIRYISVEQKPLFAIKTNLLFDLLTAINVEVEVPIGERWSVAGELIFPWWTWDNGTIESRRNRFQLLQGNLTGKYWFGEGAKTDVMTGWYGGVSAGVGRYDFERRKDGVQSDILISGSIVGGYAHTINRSGSLRMEYSLGIGYMHTDYTRYTAEYYCDDDWRAIRTSSGSYNWFGPTQAKVSLVWLLSRNIYKGGAK